MVCTSGTTGHDSQDRRARHTRVVEWRDTRNQGFASRLSHRCARRALESLANLFSILLMFQFVSHSAQQMRQAEGLLECLPCPEEFRDIQIILFSSCA